MSHTLLMAHPPFAQAWMAQWRSAAVALEEHHARELRELTTEAAQAATLALLDMGARIPIVPERWNWSGLVEQQQLLHRRRGDVEPDHPGRG
ncbi:MAG: hypothetical protein ACC726_16800 [Chloroflexota bacterium]